MGIVFQGQELVQEIHGYCRAGRAIPMMCSCTSITNDSSFCAAKSIIYSVAGSDHLLQARTLRGRLLCPSRYGELMER